MGVEASTVKSNAGSHVENAGERPATGAPYNQGHLMKNTTEIILLLDESGSMAPLERDTRGSVNTFISEQGRIPGEANLEIIVFNTHDRIIRERAPVRSIALLQESDYKPQGGTALSDALVKSIDNLGARLRALPESERPNNVIFAILTDGEENSSELPMDEAKKRIKVQTDQFGWKFIYLAAGEGALQQGRNYGLSMNNIATYNNTQKGYSAAMGIVSASVTSSRGGGSVEFTSAQRDFLNSSI